MRYLDPDVELPDIKANPETPVEGSDFGSQEALVWKEELIEMPHDPHETEEIWDYFYEAYRNHKPYPITSEQALNVVKLLEDVKLGTEFEK